MTGKNYETNQGQALCERTIIQGPRRPRTNGRATEQ